MAYKLTHPDSDLELKVEADMVAMYASQGWERLAARRRQPS